MRYQVQRRNGANHIWRVVLATALEREARERFLALSTTCERGEVRLVDTHDNQILERAAARRVAV